MCLFCEVEADAANREWFIYDIFHLLYRKRNPGRKQAVNSQTHICSYVSHIRAKNYADIHRKKNSAYMLIKNNSILLSVSAVLHMYSPHLTGICEDAAT